MGSALPLRKRSVTSLRLHPKQAEVSTHPARFKVVTAGRRWGKTALARATLISKACGGAKRKIWYVAPSYRMAKQIMWDELLEAIPKRLVKKINNTEMSVLLINGSKIECKGADDPDSLRGVGLFFVVLDEYQDMKSDVWTKVIRPTLAKDRGDAMIIGTPKGFANLYEVHALGQDPNNAMWKSWQFPTITSPFIPVQEIEDAKNDMDEKSFKQEFEASFETMSGRVYYAFDRNIHVGQYEFDPNLPVIVGVDFNVDPMTAVILQQRPDGEVWLVDEIYLRNSNTVELCDEIERRYWRHMPQNKVSIYPDPAGASRGNTRGESNIDIFREKGFKRVIHRKKHPAVRDRVNSVNRMFMDANGGIKMRVNKTCVHSIASLEQTLYKEGTPEVDKKPGVEHICDALGYPVEYIYPIRKIEIVGSSV